ncbi:MAG: hypothetical protein U0575_08615 [Phycisphaerales bacterium]|jgi:hypothetical protein
MMRTQDRTFPKRGALEPVRLARRVRPVAWPVAVALGAVISGGCVSDQARRPAPVLHADSGRTYSEAGLIFAERGPQAGTRLPRMWLVGLDGREHALDEVRAGRPMVLVTVSITSNVARRREVDLAALRERWGDRVEFVTVYTIEAHPTGAACPYTGLEWVPDQNVRDGVLVAQPTTMADRMMLAREFDQRYGFGGVMLVDPMDDIAWRTLGMAPNLGLLVDSDGVIRLRQGWFETTGMESALQALLSAGRAPTAPSPVSHSPSQPASPAASEPASTE